jgi:hypothetical protein
MRDAVAYTYFKVARYYLHHEGTDRVYASDCISENVFSIVYSHAEGAGVTLSSRPSDTKAEHSG